MRGLAGRMLAVTSVLLICAAGAVAQATKAASPAQGKYEDLPIRASAPPDARLAATQVAELDSGSGFDPLRLLLAMGIVIGLILVMRWAGRKFLPGAGVPNAGGAMKVLSRTVISPKQQLLMIQVGRRVVVVGDSGGQMSPLSEITEPEEVASLVAQVTEEKSQNVLKGFGSLFSRASSSFEEKPEPQPETPASPPDSPSVEEPAVGLARSEINELADKVRLLSSQFRR